MFADCVLFGPREFQLPTSVRGFAYLSSVSSNWPRTTPLNRDRSLEIEHGLSCDYDALVDERAAQLTHAR
jgi:hypothetical protein